MCAYVYMEFKEDRTTLDQDKRVCVVYVCVTLIMSLGTYNYLCVCVYSVFLKLFVAFLLVCSW